MPFVRSARTTSFTSEPMRTKSPVIAALPPPVGWKLMPVAPPIAGQIAPQTGAILRSIVPQPDYDGMLELFPQGYHEPYYVSYLKEDFGAIARACGLTHIRDVNAFVSKVMVFDKL
jgi:hypothetical protein